MKIKRPFYYVAWHKHVAHFRVECPSFQRMLVAGKYVKKPRGRTLCDHCQAIEKRVKRALKQVEACIKMKVKVRRARAK